MRTQMLGPEGARQRMEQLMSRMNALAPKPKVSNSNSSFQQSASDGISGEFNKTLSAEMFKPLSPFGAGMSIRSTAPREIRDMIKSVADETGIDADLFDALVAQESSYNPLARSRAGAMGLTQLMPGTARELGVTNPFDPLENLRGGARYLKQLLEQFGGDRRLALAAYNAGPGAVMRNGNQVPNITETQNYVRRILTALEAKQS